MRNARRILCCAMAVCMMCISTVSATPFESFAVGDICGTVVPQSVAITKITGTLSIDENGRGTCQGSVNVVEEYTCEATLYLQRKSGSAWKNVRTWSGEGENIRFDKQCYVTSGYDYRLKLEATAYNSEGHQVEKTSIYSNQVNY